MNQVTVSRDVSMTERHNYAGRDVKKGEVLYLYMGFTYGCIDTTYGIACTFEPDKPPFFEFPLNAIQEETRL
jgi:hypothetical protein